MPLPPQARKLTDEFARRFKRPAQVVARAPGRVNLIGEHTDYNDGFVLPMALEHSTWVAVAARDDDQVRAASLDLNAEEEWRAGAWNPRQRGEWASYVVGVMNLLRQEGARIEGVDLLISSDVPVGSGLSSSAALEVSAAHALAALGGVRLEPAALANLCRRTEHEFAGVPCGIMDQYVSALARADHAFLLDCRSRTWEHIPLELGEHTIVVVNSGVRHKLAGGEYAQRQRQCQEAVAHFQKLRPDVRALRDVRPSWLAEQAGALDPVVLARARHVVTENERTVAAAGALRSGDFARFGALMDASHVSLRDDYEVSCRELDLLAEIARGVPGVPGARMTGGGFGGCIVALALRDSVPGLAAALRTHYDGAGFGPARMILSRPGAGAAVVSG